MNQFSGFDKQKRSLEGTGPFPSSVTVRKTTRNASRKRHGRKRRRLSGENGKEAGTDWAINL